VKQHPDENDPDDVKAVARLNAKPWMYGTLALNPSYVHWGPGQDYMKGETKEGGWNSAIIQPNWQAMFGTDGFTLDDMNEVVNFYFEIERDSKECEACQGVGLNPATKALDDTFHHHERPDLTLDVAELSRRLILGENTADALGQPMPGWQHELTDEEIDHLRQENRLFNAPPSATNDEIRADYHHDAINRHLLVKHRGTRLGIYGPCEPCDGHGYTFTAPEAHLELTFWLLHPRKGASRGVTIKDVQETDLPAIYDFLKNASERNTDRFRKVVTAAVDARRAGLLP